MTTEGRPLPRTGPDSAAATQPKYPTRVSPQGDTDQRHAVDAALTYPLIERRLAGSLLVARSASLLRGLTPDDFTDPLARGVVEVVLELDEGGVSCGAADVDVQLRRTGRAASAPNGNSGPAVLGLLAGGEPLLAASDRATLLEAAARRALVRAGQRTVQAAGGSLGPVDLDELAQRWRAEVEAAIIRWRDAQAVTA